MCRRALFTRDKTVVTASIPELINVFVAFFQVATGSCGSGKNHDCNSDPDYWTELYCCQMEDGYHYQDCSDYKETHGVGISCPEKLNYNGAILEGCCGSGMWEDCDGKTHIVRR